MPKPNVMKSKAALLVIGNIIVIIVFIVLYWMNVPNIAHTALEIDLQGRKIKLETNQIISTANEVTKLDINDYYVDSAKGYSFKRLNSDIWSEPKTSIGYMELVKTKGITFNGPMQELMTNKKTGSEFLDSMETLRFTSGDMLTVTKTDSTTTQQIDDYIKEILKSTNDPDAESWMRRIVNDSIPFERLDFKNEFIVSVIEKSKLPVWIRSATLPAFAFTFLQGAGIVPQELTANDKTILMGLSETLKNVNINGATQDMHTIRTILITENVRYYYIVEIGFSSETKSSPKRWEELLNVLNSFRVIT